jgi:hypothetical protein
MIRIDKIQTALLGNVGFRDSDVTGYSYVSDENQVSSSGLYFQDSSELVTIKNIHDCQQNSEITSDQFNTLLTNMQKAVILDVCNKVLSGRSDFIISTNLYPFEKLFDNTIDKKSKFVGFEIDQKAGSIICKIPWIELSFDSEVTFNIYLYNSNLPKSPIQTKSVTTTAGESKIITLDWMVTNDETYKGGAFYLGYFEDDIGSAKAYSKNYDLGDLKISTPYFDVEPMYLDYSGTKIDINSIVYESDPYGINIGVDVYTDYTELIICNKNIFWQAIQLQMHEKVLNLIRYSTRINSTKNISVDNIKKVDLELFGNKEAGIAGVLTKLEREIANIRKSLFWQSRISKRTIV